MRNPCQANAEPLIQIKLVNRCNGGCYFCIDRFNKKGDSIDIEAILGNIDSIDNKYNKVDITGGEPLLELDYVLLLANQLKARRKYVILNTNGVLLDSAKVDLLNECIDELRVALHSFDNKKHNEILCENLDYNKLRADIKHRTFKLVANTVLTDKIGSFGDFATVLAYMGFDGARISELKDQTLDPSIHAYAKGHVRAYDWLHGYDLMKFKTGKELIETGCTDEFNYRNLIFIIKRLCGFKLYNQHTTDTLKIIYSNGEMYNDWQYINTTTAIGGKDEV